MPDLAARCQITSLNSEDALNELRGRLDWAAFVQHSYRIPFHSSSAFENTDFEGFAVVPSDGRTEPAALRDSLHLSLTALNRLKLLAPDPRAQAKYNEPTQWLGNLKGLWDNVARTEEVLARQPGT